MDLSRRLKWTIVVRLPTVCPSVRPSPVRRYLFTFATSSLKPLNGIPRSLTGSKILTSSTKFVFFGPIGKTRWPPGPPIGWFLFDFFSETIERNTTKLYWKQDINILYLVCVFSGHLGNENCRPGRPVKKMAHYTQVNDMSPFRPLVFIINLKAIN